MDPQKPIPDYHAAPTFGSRFLKDLQDRIEGIIEFFAPIVVALGGWRQILFAVALSCIGCGLGLCFELSASYSGHRWLAFGGFLLGLVWPLKR